VKLNAKDLSTLKHIEFHGKDRLKKTKIVGVSTDSRTVTAGDLFIALKGEHFDAHTFINDVFSRGAVAAIVNASANVAVTPDRTLLVVEDTTRTLGELAHVYRLRFDLPVVAIGGSNGKTTTKEMVTQVLNSTYMTLGTEGNLNNHIGVPQTLFRLRKKHDVAVVEIGTNHPGEINYLCQMIEPTHGLITNIGREHLEFFKTLDGVATEEGGLFERLRTRKKAIAFVNADDERVVGLSKGMKKRITYGFTARRVDVRGKQIGMNDEGCVRFQFSGGRQKKPVAVQLNIPGEHNALNALAAAAVGLTFQVPAKRIAKTLEAVHPTSKRMEVLNFGGVVIFNDTYNANPDSMVAALQTLANARVSGNRIAVLADMRELGEVAPAEHRRVGEHVKKLGINYLLTFGDLSRQIYEAAGIPNAFHYDQKNMLAEYLAELIAPGDAVLIKGSRGMKMEDVVFFLEERLQSAVVPFG